MCRAISRYLELLDALLYGLDVRAEVQPPLLLQLLLCLSQPSPNAAQVRVQLLPLLLVLLGAHLFAEVLSLQELPALNHACVRQHHAYYQGHFKQVLKHQKLFKARSFLAVII